MARKSILFTWSEKVYGTFYMVRKVYFLHGQKKYILFMWLEKVYFLHGQKSILFTWTEKVYFKIIFDFRADDTCTVKTSRAIT